MWQMRALIETIVGLVLCGFSIEDLHNLGVEKWKLILFSGLIFWPGEGEKLLGLLLGSIFVVISYMTREQIGYADSWILLVLAAFLGWERFLLLLSVSFLLLELVGVALLIKNHFKRGLAIPMIPFLFFGYVIVYAKHWFFVLSNLY